MPLNEASCPGPPLRTPRGRVEIGGSPSPPLTHAALHLTNRSLPPAYRRSQLFVRNENMMVSLAANQSYITSAGGGSLDWLLMHHGAGLAPKP